MAVIVGGLGESVWNGLGGVDGQREVKDLVDDSGIFSYFDIAISFLDDIRLHYPV